MEARTLEAKLNYLGQERAIRRLLTEEKIASAEEVALMTCVEACEKLLEEYEVVSCEDEDITIVKKDDMKTYNSIVRYLSR